MKEIKFYQKLIGSFVSDIQDSELQRVSEQMLENLSDDTVQSFCNLYWNLFVSTSKIFLVDRLALQPEVILAFKVLAIRDLFFSVLLTTAKEIRRKLHKNLFTNAFFQ